MHLPDQPGLPDSVLLITPPSVFLLDERVFVNLGILRVAAVLEQRGIRVEHLDLSAIENGLELLATHLRQTRCRVAGVTVTTPQLPMTARILRRIREERPDMKIILGGPHVTLTHSATKLEAKAGRRARAHAALAQLTGLADVLVSGDGELAVFQALREDSPPVVDGDDPRGGYFLTDQTYELVPYPARHLVDLESYRYQIEGHKSTSLIAQLGCPFACGFCGGRNSMSLRRIRTRSVESIVNEVRLLHERWGFRGFMFYDDELNVSKSVIPLMNALADLQTELATSFHFRGFVKAELFDRDQAKAMYRAGFRWLLSGFESGAPRILSNINKQATLEDNTRAVGFAREAGLKVKALMSVGHPGESDQTIEQTRSWLLSVAPDDFDCTVITTYPGTPYYDEALPHPERAGVWTYRQPRSGDRLHAIEVNFLEVAEYYKGDPKGGYRSFVFTDHLSPEEIVSGRDRIESTVREALKIPYPSARPALRFEHSMGQGAHVDLPAYVLGVTGAGGGPTT